MVESRPDRSNRLPDGMKLLPRIRETTPYTGTVMQSLKAGSISLDDICLQHREGVTGSSEFMDDVFRLIDQAGPSETSILISGDSARRKDLGAAARCCLMKSPACPCGSEKKTIVKVLAKAANWSTDLPCISRKNLRNKMKSDKISI